MDSEATPTRVQRIGLVNVLAILVLGTSGQIAWIVENSWFNVFVYDEITQDPAPVAWMVAVSAIVATVTTIIMGIASDRSRNKMGKRKPFIVFGYVAWGIMTALFPTVGLINVIGLAVVMVVFMDAVMTFFGSMANDAAFSAWITDIGHSSNRNRIQAINSITGFIAAIVALGAAGIIIDLFGFYVFFFVLGGIVSVTGVLSMILVKPEPPGATEPRPERSFAAELRNLLDPSMLRNERTLFLLFTNMALSGIAVQVYTPYLLIFIENYLGLDKTTMSLYLALFVLLTVVFLVIIGLVSHRFNRKTILLAGTITGSVLMITVGLVAPALLTGSVAVFPLLFLYFLGTLPAAAAGVVHGGWLQDSYPGGNIGKYQGIRMIFMVMIPMVIGPPIGSAVITAFGIPAGDGFIPTPEIFVVGGIISLLAVVPVLFIPKGEGRVRLLNVRENDHGTR